MTQLDRVLVVIPAFNEEASVAAVVGAVLGQGVDALVVDDGSTDATGGAGAARRRGRRLPAGEPGCRGCAALRVPLRRVARLRGRRPGRRRRPARRRGDPGVARADDARPRLTWSSGSRFDATGPGYAVRGGRRLAMRLLAARASRSVGGPITDATSGMRAIRRPLLEDFARDYPVEYLGDTVEAMVIAGRRGARIVECPIAMSPRAAGRPSAGVLASGWYVTRVLLRDRADATPARSAALAGSEQRGRALSLLARERVDRHAPVARTPAGRTLGVLALAVAAAVLLLQVANGKDLLDVQSPLTAGFAKALVLFYGLAVTGVAVAAGFLPRRMLALPVLAAGGLAALALVATLTIGAEAWSFAAALLVMCACWLLGEWLLRGTRGAGARGAGSSRLARRRRGARACAVVRGAAPGSLRWWTFGAPVLIVGALGAVMLARSAGRAVPRRRRGATSLGSPRRRLRLDLPAAARARLRLDRGARAHVRRALREGLAACGMGAHRRDRPAPLPPGAQQRRLRPADRSAGPPRRRRRHGALPPVLAAAGGASRRSGGRVRALALGPAVAAALAVTPHLFWQATTAIDDALLALGRALGMASRRRPARGRGRPRGARGSRSVLLAGACIDYKLHSRCSPRRPRAGWSWRDARAPRPGRARRPAGSSRRCRRSCCAGSTSATPAAGLQQHLQEPRTGRPSTRRSTSPSTLMPGTRSTSSVQVGHGTELLNEAAPVGAFGFLRRGVLVVLVAGGGGARPRSWAEGSGSRSRRVRRVVLAVPLPALPAARSRLSRWSRSALGLPAGARRDA